jgi:signal peptidase I
LSNCDHEVLLWVNGETVSFEGPTTYETDVLPVPVWSEEDAGDLQPARIGTEGAAVKASHLRIYRDKYYIAVNRAHGYDDMNDYLHDDHPDDIQAIYADPTTWQTTGLFDPQNRRYVDFEMHEDEFFPLGDNSPHSSDARLWDPLPHVHRDLLIGRALFIYWPHTWNSPIPFWPNFRRMGPIH